MDNKLSEATAATQAMEGFVQAAQTVIAEHRRLEQERERAARLPLVGKFFKYRNSYGGGEDWYAAVTGINEWTKPEGWSFQLTTRGSIGIEHRAFLSTLPLTSGGWQEIPATEFWRQAQKVSTLVASRLTRPQR